MEPSAGFQHAIPNSALLILMATFRFAAKRPDALAAATLLFKAG